MKDAKWTPWRLMLPIYAQNKPTETSAVHISPGCAMEIRDYLFVTVWSTSLPFQVRVGTGSSLLVSLERLGQISISWWPCFLLSSA